MGNFCGNSAIPFQNSQRKQISKDDFQILQVIGTGAFGKILLVRKRNTGKLYALKVINKNKLELTNTQSQAITQKDILSTVNSNFVVKLHYSFQDQFKLFFVLDYMAGGTLFQVIKRYGRCSQNITRLYLCQIVMGLQALHQEFIIYRDLKPENILLDNSGHLKLADFNMSKIRKGDFQSQTFAGTAEYLAPEILKQLDQTVAIDFWCLGILAYELLVGVPPFRGRTRKILYEKILNQKVEFPYFVSEEARELICSLMEKEFRERLQNFEEIKQHIFFQAINWNEVAHKFIQLPLPPPKVQYCFTVSTVESHSEKSCEEYDNFSYVNSPR